LADERYVAKVDAVLESLIPRYMERRRADLTTIRQGVEAGDFEAIALLGHSMKGSGGGYGFDLVTECGGRIEDAAGVGDAVGILAEAELLEHYLDTVVVEILESED